MRCDKRHIIWFPAVVALLATVAVAVAQEKVRLDTDPHLMGWWKFDETTGKTASDSSKHKRNGTLNNELTFDKASVDGKFGKALKLGRNDAVDIKGYKGVTGTSPRTVTAWIKTKNTRGDIAVWGTNDSGKQFRGDQRLKQLKIHLSYSRGGRSRIPEGHDDRSPWRFKAPIRDT